MLDKKPVSDLEIVLSIWYKTYSVSYSVSIMSLRRQESFFCLPLWLYCQTQKSGHLFMLRQTKIHFSWNQYLTKIDSLWKAFGEFWFISVTDYSYLEEG